VRGAAVALVIALGVACGGAARAGKPTEVGDVQRGKAAWYGARFQGRKTASGERFDRAKLTAAHRTLPFGTRVRVTNLANDRSVVVRVNDRGPFGKRGGIIDVSEAAARKLGMLRAGIVKVKIEVIELGKREAKRRSGAP
jgi:rare lipoprotein A